MKVALVYDRVNKWGGAERTILALHELFPNAPLFTAVYNKKTAPWASVFPKVIPSLLQQFPLASVRHDAYAPLMPLAFESFTFDEFDLVISVTSEAAKGIITKPKTIHICYCLTPTRYLWSGYEFYFQNPFFRFAAAPIVSYLRAWDRIAAARPDVYIAISKEVQQRIKKYYGRESVVMYPPAEISNSKLQIANKFQIPNSKLQGGDYFLVVSRLVPYKRVDLAIKAFNILNTSLVIVGSGSQLPYLRSLAGPTIGFVGNLTDDELVGYYTKCRALVFPSHEDFGLVAVEAQACGKPVIAFKGGGAQETVIDGKTGVLFSSQDEQSLIAAVKECEKLRFRKSDCRNNAKRFFEDRFKEQFMAIVEEVVRMKE